MLILRDKREYGSLGESQTLQIFIHVRIVRIVWSDSAELSRGISRGEIDESACFCCRSTHYDHRLSEDRIAKKRQCDACAILNELAPTVHIDWEQRDLVYLGNNCRHGEYGRGGKHEADG